MARQDSRSAIVGFASGAAAARPVAGVAAAARIARELDRAGFDRAWFVLPPGEKLSATAARDVERLAGRLDTAIVHEAPAEPNATRLAGDRLVDSTAIGKSGEGLRLDGPAADFAILRATGKAGDGPVSHWLNRPISRALSFLLLKIPGFRPLHATIGTMAIALIMFACLVAGGAKGLIAGGLLFQAASVFDGVDGEVARATFRTSRAGAALDTVVDVGTNMMFILGVTLNLGGRGQDMAYMLGAWGFSLFVLGLSIIAARASRAHGHFSLDLVKHDYEGVPGRIIPSILRFFTIVSSRDFFALLFAVLIATGAPMAVLLIFAAATTLWILFVLGSLLMDGPAAQAVRRR